MLRLRGMLRAGETDIVHAEEPESKLAVASQLKLGLAKSYYTMAQALGLQKLQDLVLVSGDVSNIRKSMPKFQPACTACRVPLLCQVRVTLSGCSAGNTKAKKLQMLGWTKRLVQSMLAVTVLAAASASACVPC